MNVNVSKLAQRLVFNGSSLVVPDVIRPTLGGWNISHTQQEKIISTIICNSCSAIHCPCGLFYGESRELRTQKCEHCSGIRCGDVTNSVEQQFREGSHSVSEFLYFGIKQVVPVARRGDFDMNSRSRETFRSLANMLLLRFLLRVHPDQTVSSSILL